MQERAIYQKTARGVEAIATRDRALAPRLRSLLILIDGKRRPDELAKLTVSGDIAPLVDELVELGMVEATAVAAPPPATAAPSPAAAPAMSKAALVEVQRLAARRVTEMLGPSGEDLCIRIEGTKTAADLATVLKRVEAVLQEVRGPQQASAFASEIQARLTG